MAGRDTPDLGGGGRQALAASLVCVLGGIVLWVVTGDGVFFVRGAQFAVGLVILSPLIALLAGAEDDQPPSAAWSAVGDDDRFARTGAETALPPDSDVTTPVYETRVDDRPITARIAGGDPGDPETVTTTVETPLRAVSPGDGVALDDTDAVDAVDWLPGDPAADLRDHLDDGASVTVDDRLGVVRWETDGVVTDADDLVAVATAVAGLADAVERQANDAERQRTVERT